jgi:hypothetical protein
MNNTMSKDNPRNTDEINGAPSVKRAEPEARQAEIIEVHFYEQAIDEETLPDKETTVESDADLVEPAVQTLERRAPQRRKRIRLVLSLLALALLVLVAIAGSLAYFLLLPLPVTVTLVPMSKRVQTTDTITLVTGGNTDSTKGEIAGRSLSSITISQAETVATTGTTVQPATSAHGTITFYNAGLEPQTLVVDTLITGKDGVQVVTDQTITVPAATYPQFGEASVPAHAVILGESGNIAAHDLDGDCCLLKISAVSSAFVGGLEATHYQSVSQSDRDRATTSLKTTLDQSVIAALSTQVRSGERLLTPPNCEMHSKTDHEVGEQATEVQVTVSATCAGVAYEASAFEQRITQTQHPLEHYRLASSPEITVMSVTTGSTAATYTLSVQSTATWVYAFSQSELSALAKSLAGKTTKEATHDLLHTTGVQSVSMSTNTTLPTNPQKIHFLFVVQS